MASSFFERYLELCRQAGETPNSVAKIIGASSGSVTAWKNGTEPRKLLWCSCRSLGTEANRNY